MRRSLLAAAQWTGTAVGVVVLLLVVSGQVAAGWGWVVLGTVAVSAVVPTLVGLAYLVLRSRNRSLEHAGAEAVAPRRRAVQRGLASLVERTAGDHAGALVLQRAVVEDRTRISAVSVSAFDDVEELLAFLWFVRPSQPDGFVRSSELAGLPQPVQDAVVLLDLRRELQLRGAEHALADGEGVYRHPFDRTVVAAVRTANAELVGELRLARRAVVSGAALGDDVTGRLIACIDEPATWNALLAE